MFGRRKKPDRQLAEEVWKLTEQIAALVKQSTDLQAQLLKVTAERDALSRASAKLGTEHMELLAKLREQNDADLLLNTARTCFQIALQTPDAQRLADLSRGRTELITQQQLLAQRQFMYQPFGLQR